jgi:hypothetical protein
MNETNTFALSANLEACETAIAKAVSEIEDLKAALPYADSRQARSRDEQRIRQLENDRMRFIAEKQEVWAQYEEAFKSKLVNGKLFICISLETHSLGAFHAYPVIPSDAHLADLQIKHIATVNLSDLAISFDDIDFHSEREQAIQRKLDYHETAIEAQVNALDSAA